MVSGCRPDRTPALRRRTRRALLLRLAVEPLARRRLQARIELGACVASSAGGTRRSPGSPATRRSTPSGRAELVGRPVTTIENPIAEHFFDPPDAPRSTDVVALVASLVHEPNADAIEWMAKEIWPRIVAARPHARLVVAGRGDPHGRAEARLRPSVERAGGELRVDLDDIRPVYWEAAVAVAPVRGGAGVRNKVLHALAAGAPVVATPAALEGIRPSVTSSVRTAPADDAGAFARAVVDVLDDREAAGRARAAVADLAPLRMSEIGPAHDRWWQSLVARA